jgi:hypothetical protein
LPRGGSPYTRIAALVALPATLVARGSDATEPNSNDPEEQEVWLDGSSDPPHVVLDGGHEIYEDDPEGAAAQVVKVTERLRSR